MAAAVASDSDRILTDSSHLEAADLLQNLTLDSQTKTTDVPEATKKPTAIQHGPVDAVGVDGPVQSYEQSTTPQLQQFTDPTMSYPSNGYSSAPYYYGGYDGSTNDWNEYPSYVTPDGVEMAPGVYGDDGSIMYHNGYGYAPYGAYSPIGSPVPTMVPDGQLYGPQHYQYPSLYRSSTPPNVPYPPNQALGAQGDVSTSVSANQAPFSVKASNGDISGSVLPGGIPAPGYQDPRFGFDGMWSPVPWLDAPALANWQPRPATSNAISSTFSHINNTQAGRNQSFHPLPHLMGLQSPSPTPAFVNSMYPNNKMYRQYGSPARTGGGFGSHGYDSRTNGHGWLAVDGKNKPRGRRNSLFGYGNENMDGLNELNRGPRARDFNNQNLSAPFTSAVNGKNISANDSSGDKDNSNVIPDNEMYNSVDFPENYSDVKCFIIKSYSEDDVHKSIKYGVWASTPNGNKKLDAGYREAQEKSGDCPVFLFFSVNTSGQFVGVAEMVGPVEFNKNVEYWQQDKWTGCFPVKWHIVKDLPNSLLRHITLENNDNKPVTNSRDTQEVKFEQGLHMLKIFKEHSCKTSILDDFGFYEAREKTIQEKRAKQQQFQKQVWDRTSTADISDEKERVTNGKLGLQKSIEIISPLIEEPSAAAAAQINGEKGESEEN